MPKARLRASRSAPCRPPDASAAPNSIPLFSFTDRDNKEVTFTSEDGSARPDKFKPGDKFPVIYVKEDPVATAQADAGYELLALPAVFAVFGLLFLLGGLPKGSSETL